MVAGFALGIALWSARTARANLLIAQGNAVSRLLDAYAAPDMASAVTALRLSEKPVRGRLTGQIDVGDFPREIRKALKERFETPTRTAIGHPVADPDAAFVKVLRDSGRRIHWFVRQADILRRNGAMSDDLFREAIAETAGYCLWTTVWLP